MRGLLKGTATITGYLLLLYLVPTLVERILLIHFGPWLACVVFGDLIGCVVLFTLFRVRSLAVILYAACGLMDAFLIKRHLVSLDVMTWITDLAPALLAGLLCASAGVYLFQSNESDFFSDEFQEY